LIGAAIFTRLHEVCLQLVLLYTLAYIELFQIKRNDSPVFHVLK